MFFLNNSCKKKLWEIKISDFKSCLSPLREQNFSTTFCKLIDDEKQKFIHFSIQKDKTIVTRTGNDHKQSHMTSQPPANGHKLPVNKHKPPPANNHKSGR